MRRRDFLAATSAAAALAACGSKAAPPLPPGTLTGANDVLGHRLRRPDFPAPTETLRTTVAHTARRVEVGDVERRVDAEALLHGGCRGEELEDRPGAVRDRPQTPRARVDGHFPGCRLNPSLD